MPQRMPSHVPPRLRRSRGEDRPNAAQRGYCSAAHRAWRQAVLTRDRWQCRTCGRLCSSSREAHADHITPLALGGSRYSPDNGQTLCVRCHSRKTCTEQRQAAGGVPRIINGIR